MKPYGLVIPLLSSDVIWLLRTWSSSHYLKQCWLFVNWSLKHKPLWNLIQNTKLYLPENIFEKCNCQIAAILFSFILSNNQRETSLWIYKTKYSAVPSFLPNPHNRHPIYRPHRQAMGCLLLFWYLIYVLSQSLQHCMIIPYYILTHHNDTWLWY